MSQEIVRIAVISDIHAAQPDPANKATPSYASTAPSGEPIERDAVLSLEKLISSAKLQADYLICCGDMANQADPTAMTYIWSKFNALSAMLGARPLATVGNHDVDSRHVHNDHDARGLLRGLSPPYPLQDHIINNEFWSRNFVVIEDPRIRFVVLNSCAYHGVNPTPSAPEYIHGRLSKFTLSDLKARLGSAEQYPPLNVLLCHHHPHKHQDIELADYSTMIGGEQLIDALAQSDVGPWMILHGHKHHPRLIYGAGAGRAPLVFGAGSLSAKLSGDMLGAARNQFYIIEFNLTAAANLGLDLAGEVFAWDYKLGVGWERATPTSGLPARSGFGYRVSQLSLTANRIRAEVDNQRGIATWQHILSAIPELKYALPADLQALGRELRKQSIGIIIDSHGDPIQFGVGAQ